MPAVSPPSWSSCHRSSPATLAPRPRRTVASATSPASSPSAIPPLPRVARRLEHRTSSTAAGLTPTAPLNATRLASARSPPPSRLRVTLRLPTRRNRGATQGIVHGPVRSPRGTYVPVDAAASPISAADPSLTAEMSRAANWGRAVRMSACDGYRRGVPEFCPCGSRVPYADCCGRLHSGDAVAGTPEGADALAVQRLRRG